MHYITNTRIGGYYKREAEGAERGSGFRVKHEDAEGFTTAAAARAVIASEKLTSAAVVEFSDAQIADIEERRAADLDTHEERTTLAAEHQAAEKAKAEAPAD